MGAATIEIQAEKTFSTKGTITSGTMMKALVYHAPGKSVVSHAWEDRPRPTLLEATDALVRITTTTICGTDLHILKGDVPTVADGRILGHEGIGVVEAVGARLRGQASMETLVSRVMRLAWARLEAGAPQKVIRGVPRRLRVERRCRISGVSPLAERARRMSPGAIMPMSPWTASAG